MKNLICDFIFRLFYAFPLDTNVEAKMKTSFYTNIKYHNSIPKKYAHRSIYTKNTTAFRGRSKVSEKIALGDD